MMLIMMWMVMVMMMMLAMMKTSTAQPAAFLSCSGQPPKIKKYLNSLLDLLYPPPSFKKSFLKVENTHTQFSR